MKNRLLASLTILLLSACANLTPQQQQAVNVATQLAEGAVTIAAARYGVPPSTTQAALAALTQQNPQAATLALNSLWGGMQQAQAGQPVAQGAAAKPIGTAIAQNVPAGLGPNSSAALLQQAATLLAANQAQAKSAP